MSAPHVGQTPWHDLASSRGGGVGGGGVGGLWFRVRRRHTGVVEYVLHDDQCRLDVNVNNDHVNVNVNNDHDDDHVNVNVNDDHDDHDVAALG
jgi:hypothetical protein